MDDLQTFRGLLRINKHRLDDELEVQAEVMGRISDKIASLAAKAAETSDALKTAEARIYRQLKDDDDKLTDKAADSAVRRHQDRARAFERVTLAHQELAQWQGLYDAWKARGFDVRKLCDLYSAQYYTKDSYTPRNRDHNPRNEQSALRERRAYEGERTQNYGSSTRRRIGEG